MNRKPKIIYFLICSFFMCFMFVGYSKLTDSINISGEIEGEVQKDVFITNIINPTSNITLNGFYSTIFDQTVSLDSNSEATYFVSLYNNNGTSKFIYDGYILEDLPSGVEVVVEEVLEGDVLEPNCISSFINSKSYDTFKVTYRNITNESKQITTPIKFQYTEFTTQVKIVINYEGEEYIKYTKKEDENDNEYKNVIFDQISIDLSDNTKNLVARCNRGGLLNITNDNHLEVSNITNYSSVAAGELDISINLFDSLTEAVNYNSGVFENDTTPNNFLVLQDINDTIESTTDSIVVLNNRRYSINLDGKKVQLHKPIINNNFLKVYDSNTYIDPQLKGLIKIVDTDSDIFHNDLSTAHLLIKNINLSLTTSSKVVSSDTRDINAIVVAHEGLVEIKDSTLTSDYGYGIFKKNISAGEKFREKTSNNSKVLVENSTVKMEYNNAIRLEDGSGYVSIVGSYISSCETLDVEYDDQKDPIYASRHRTEKMVDIDDDFDFYYRYAVTELKVYITASTIKLNSPWKVNHFYSDDDLNARLFYTNSVSFDSVLHVDGKEGCRARTAQDQHGFNYPIAMVNGNGATYSDLVNDDETFKDHYLNEDGWYYIYQTIADLDEDYTTTGYISGSTYAHLEHFGDIIKVGDSFELINFNNPGQLYIDIDQYDNTTSYFVPLTDVPNKTTQGEFTGYDFEFTFLASSDQYYFNIASLGELGNVFHVENRGGYSPNEYTVGIKYISTTKTGVELDKNEQRFTLMTYNHPEVGTVKPYVFVSKYESVISYMKTADSYNNETEKWNASALYVDSDYSAKGGIASALIDTSPVYEYDFEQYLFSNKNGSNGKGLGFKRNGWYLWQEDIPKYSNEYITNGSTMPTQGKLYTMTDNNSYIYVSSQSSVSSEGILLNSKEHNLDDGDNYGYIRIYSKKEICGIEFEIENVSDSEYITNTPYLLLRTYSLNTNGTFDNITTDYQTFRTQFTRQDYEIQESSVPRGLYRPLDSNGGKIYDLDEVNLPGAPYYVIVEKTGSSMTIKVIFDAKYESWNLHSITLDPFNDAVKDNTMLIKNIKLIHPPGN